MPTLKIKHAQLINRQLPANIVLNIIIQKKLYNSLKTNVIRKVLFFFRG